MKLKTTQRRTTMKLKTSHLFAGLILLTIILFSMAGCADSDSGDSTADLDDDNSVYTLAVISDSHIKNTAVQADTKNANNKLRHLGDKLSAMNLDFVVHTGDHVNDLYCPELKSPALDVSCPVCAEHIQPDYLTYKCCVCNVNCYGDQLYALDGHHSHCPPAILLKYAEIIDKHFWDIPEYYMVLGNHDDRILSVSVIRPAAKQAWGRVFGLEKSKGYPVPPAIYSDKHKNSYYDVTYYKGFHLIMLDSTAERPSSSSKDPDYNDEIHFGEDQLAWLDATLSKNPDPAILFWHTRPKDFDESKHPYLSILARHKGKIRAIFTGHSHHFKKYTWQDIRFYETTSTVCEFDPSLNIPSYYLVQLNAADGSVVILNEEEIFGEHRDIAEKSCAAY